MIWAVHGLQRVSRVCEWMAGGNNFAGNKSHLVKMFPFISLYAPWVGKISVFQPQVLGSLFLPMRAYVGTSTLQSNLATSSKAETRTALPPPAIPCLCLYPGRAPLWVLFMIGKIEVTQVFISRKWAHGNVLIKWNTWQRLSGNLSYMRQHTWISQIQCNPKMYKSRFFWCHLHNVFKCVMSIIGNPM